MNLVIRSTYGDDSIALIESIRLQAIAHPQRFTRVYVVYIDTAWAGKGWDERILQGEDYVKRIGFLPIRLQAKATFAEMVIERNQFPSRKFQWCAGFLKGLPLLEWLDERDPALEWTIAIAKRQALYRKPIPAEIAECEYHGDRRVWHPMVEMTQEVRNTLVLQAGFEVLSHRSLECEPCVNSSAADIARMSSMDQSKRRRLEMLIAKPMIIVGEHQDNQNPATMDQFSMGCGDPFGCGL